MATTTPDPSAPSQAQMAMLTEQAHENMRALLALEKENPSPGPHLLAAMDKAAQTAHSAIVSAEQLQSSITVAEQRRLMSQIMHDIKLSKDTQFGIRVKVHDMISRRPVASAQPREQPETPQAHPVGSQATHTCHYNQYVGTFTCNPTEQQCRDNSPIYCSLDAINKRVLDAYNTAIASNQQKMASLRRKSQSTNATIHSLRKEMRKLEARLKVQRSNLKAVQRQNAPHHTTSIQLLRHHSSPSPKPPADTYTCTLKNKKKIELTCRGGHSCSSNDKALCSPDRMQQGLNQDISDTVASIDKLGHQIRNMQDTYKAYQTQNHTLMNNNLRLKKELYQDRRSLVSGTSPRPASPRPAHHHTSPRPASPRPAHHHASPRPASAHHASPRPASAHHASPRPASAHHTSPRPAHAHHRSSPKPATHCLVPFCSKDNTCPESMVCSDERIGNRRICIDSNNAVKSPSIDRQMECPLDKMPVWLDNTARCTLETEQVELCMHGSHTQQQSIQLGCLDSRELQRLYSLDVCSYKNHLPQIMHDGKLLCSFQNLEE